MVDAAPFVALRADGAASTSTALVAAGHDGRWADVLDRYRRLRTAGQLRPVGPPSLYVYDIEDVASDRAVRGMVAAVALDADALRPHEEVRPDQVRRLEAQLRAEPVELVPLMAVHAPSEPLRRLLDAQVSTDPAIDVRDERGSRHRVWPVVDDRATTALRAACRPLVTVLADGHHRFAAARQLRASATGDAPCDHRIGVWLVPADARGPEVLSIPRRARFADRSWRERLTRLGRLVPMAPGSVPQAVEDRAGHAVGVVARGLSGILALHDVDALRERLPPHAPAAWGNIDAALLHHALLPWLGAIDVEAEVPSGGSRSPLWPIGDPADSAWFCVRGETAKRVLDVALAGALMPWKTTWFRPKPAAGLLLRELGGHGAAPLPGSGGAA